VTRIFYAEATTVSVKADGGFEKIRERNLDTEGSNLLATLSHPMVDATRTSCNDVVEILTTLGIEVLFFLFVRVVSVNSLFL